MFWRLIALFLLSSAAFGQGTVSSTCIWSGTVADCLPSAGLLLRDQRDLRLGEAAANGSNYVAMQAPATLGADVTLTMPADDGDANEFLQTNGSGTLTWEPVDASTDVTGVLPLANGGTNKNATAVNGGLVWSDADSLEITAAGTAQQWVLSGGAGTPTMSNTTTTGKIIDGTADEIQLQVQGNGTQTSNIFVVDNSAGQDIYVVQNTGATIAGINDTGTATDISHLLLNNTVATQQTVYVKNLSTSTSSDGLEGIVIQKGSATNTTAQFFMRFEVNAGTSSGRIVANGAGAAAFAAASDEKLKKNVIPLGSQLKNIMALKPVEFDYKDGSGHQIGFVAQDMKSVYPDSVGPMQKGLLQISGWSKTEARLVRAIQDLKIENDALKARLDKAGL